ncbi:MAG: hypothetical protein JRJ79_17730 [Deltaproteobacteria bacterium]|nr:hypothetical protein [Deltaproteobacteria bacterium]
MKFEEFEANLRTLTTWYRKKLDDDQILLWYKRISHLPLEAWRWIVDTIIDADKFFPTPERVKGLFSDWLREHPERSAQRYEQTWCDDCEGKGYHRIWYQDPRIKGYVVDGRAREMWYSTIVPCSQCQNWKGAFPRSGPLKPIKYWTRQALLDAGYILENPKTNPPPSRSWNSVDEMAEDIAIPF